MDEHPKPDPPPSSPLLTIDETASYLKVSRRQLQYWRTRRTPGGPPYVKLGGRSVRYRLTDLDSWLHESVTGEVSRCR